MKNYHEQHIRAAEILQLILLQHIYAQSGSQKLIFQGGTALRWCYGGGRFSEDLDFVFSSPLATVDRIMTRALKGAERELIPHFGAGRLTVSDKSSRSGSRKLLVSWQPDKERRRIAVKVEFEPLATAAALETVPLVLSALPAVSYLMTSGDFRIPRPNSVLVVESAAEILSDKVRALLERTYLKGRDLYDVWFLTAQLGTTVGRADVERKFYAYHWPFTAARTLDYFCDPDEAAKKEIETAMSQDLERFLPSQVLKLYRDSGYSQFFAAVHNLCTGLRAAGLSP